MDMLRLLKSFNLFVFTGVHAAARKSTLEDRHIYSAIFGGMLNNKQHKLNKAD